MGLLISIWRRVSQYFPVTRKQLADTEAVVAGSLDAVQDAAQDDCISRLVEFKKEVRAELAAEVKAFETSRKHIDDFASELRGQVTEMSEKIKNLRETVTNTRADITNLRTYLKPLDGELRRIETKADNKAFELQGNIKALKKHVNLVDDDSTSRDGLKPIIDELFKRIVALEAKRITRRAASRSKHATGKGRVRKQAGR